MKLIDGKIFDRVKPQLVMDYLKNLDIKIISLRKSKNNTVKRKKS